VASTPQAIDGYLLDTSVVLAARYEGSANHELVTQWIESHGENPVFVSVVTRGELEFGDECFRIKHRSESPLPSDELTADYEVLLVSDDAAEAYGKLRAIIFAERAPTLFAKSVRGRSMADLVDEITDRKLSIQENDLWLVSVAMAHNLIFVTVDKAGGMDTIVTVAQYESQTIFL